jgi:hypothetical protein
LEIEAHCVVASYLKGVKSHCSRFRVSLHHSGLPGLLARMRDLVVPNVTPAAAKFCVMPISIKSNVGTEVNSRELAEVEDAVPNS